MRATWIGFGALVLVAAAALPAQANPYYWGGPPQAPDACGPGFCVMNPWGMVYGPNYWLTPAGLPFNGLRPPPQRAADCAQQSPNFPIHPYARGPRDYFMIYDNWYDIPYYRR